MRNNTNKPIIIWLFTGCIMIYLMVVIGGITRLTHSGLSMVEWNPIIGSIPPMSDADWQIPFDKYKQRNIKSSIINFLWKNSNPFIGGNIFIVSSGEQ